MTTYLPYFYIIRDKRNGKMYAGSRWAKDCNPSEFMKVDGYTTSSKIINNIINQFGVETFEVLRIDTECDGQHPYEYETKFLTENNCATSDNWYNKHENHQKSIGDSVGFGTESFKDSMMSKYGVDNPSKNESIKTRATSNRIKTINQKFGDNFPNIEKFRETCINKFGHSHPMKSPKVQKAKEQTCLESFGAINPFMLESHKKLVSEKCQERITCPHCGKSGKWSGMRRWHFSKCKSLRTKD